MRKLQLAQQTNAVSLARSEGRRAPFTHPVESENRTGVKRARKERAGSVTFVMFRKYKSSPPRRRQAAGATDVANGFYL